MTTRPRLSLATLAKAAPGVARPAYDVAGLKTGIVHLGIGAFHRGHQAVFTEDAVAAAGGDWGIVGLSLRHPDVPDALAAQDGLYAVETLDAAPRYRVVGVVRRAICAPRDPAAALQALAAPSTHMVGLTVTEKGYGLDARGELDPADPDIAHDLAHELAGPAAPRSAVGWLALGLAERRRAGAGPLTVISCDNVMGNGRKLEGAVLAFAERTDPGLARWIAANAAFPQTMVDCITPAVSPQVRERIEAAVGLADGACVSREAFAQWVIEDRFAGPRPAWERAGVEVVADVRPYEQLKLHVLNTCHSALAYMGPARGCLFARQAIADPELACFVDGLMAEEVAPALPDLPVADYWRRIRARIANPMVDHRLSQIAEDGSVKLAQRVVPLVVANARAGRPAGRLCAIVRAWLGAASLGEAADPKAARLAAWADAGADLAAALDDPALFPEPFRAEPAVRAAMLKGAG
ncbi:MAG: mannitol dehydrogenase family protein [Caulobacteraceae bacterium]|nr:mannitol dehydrogenase family protein [Caulobacteraceae bacterium]